MKKLTALLTLTLVAALLLAACAPSGAPATAPNLSRPETMGTILLSVNPEIEVEYDDQGLVIEVAGLNPEGKAIVSGLTGLTGKPAAQTLSRLVTAIYETGGLELDLDGNPKNIVVLLEEGSRYPDEAFLEEMAQSVQAAMDAQEVAASAMTVEPQDLNDSGLIGLEKAKELVLAQLGLTEADFVEKEYDLDDGVYELEFTANGVEYEYEVDAYTGKILKADQERADWNPGQAPTDSSIISLEEAKAAVLAYLNITEDQTRWLRSEYDEGKYDIEFWVDRTEYDFEVDAFTGRIVGVDQETEAGAQTPADPTDPADPGLMSVEEAKTIVFQHLGITEDQVSRLRTELDDGYKYEIDFWVGQVEYEFDVDGYTGKILSQDKEDHSRVSNPAPTDPVNPTLMSLEEAKAIVFQSLGISESQVTRLKVELDEGKYEIEFHYNGMEYDCEVDAYSGKILEMDKDRDD